MVVVLEKAVGLSEIAGRKPQSKDISQTVERVPIKTIEAPDAEDTTYHRRPARNRIQQYHLEETAFLPEEKKSEAPDFSYLGSGVRYALFTYAREHGVSVHSRKGWMGPLEFRRAVQASLALWVFRTCDRLPPDDQERVRNKLRCEPYAVTLMRIEERTAPVRTQDYDLAKTIF